MARNNPEGVHSQKLLGLQAESHVVACKDQNVEGPFEAESRGKLQVARYLKWFAWRVCLNHLAFAKLNHGSPLDSLDQAIWLAHAGGKYASLVAYVSKLFWCWLLFTCYLLVSFHLVFSHSPLVLLAQSKSPPPSRNSEWGEGLLRAVCERKTLYLG